MARSPNYLKAAFLFPGNLVALGVAGLGTAYFADPTALLATLGLEALYLGLVASAQPFRRAIRARFGQGDDAASAELDGLLADLSASQREHYGFLRDLRDKILANYRKLPGGGVMVASSEQRVDALLTDINQAGLGRGLEFELFRPGAQRVADFYSELPIQIKVTGSYHDMGAFASDVAQLSRIVTLNNITIQAEKSGLSMEAIAKTFRYLDDDELAAQRKTAKPGAAK